MVVQIALQCFEVRVRALAGDEAQLHQSARCIVDEHQQRTRSTAALEPAMVTVIDLDQLAVALTPETRLMKASSLLAG